MSSRPSLVDTPPFEPVPAALLVDTSVLIGLGATGADKAAFVDYVTTTDKHVYLSPDVVDELQTDDADKYGVNGWLEELRQQEWLDALPSLDEGIRIHDAPTASSMMDRAHERLAKLEQREQDDVRKTDPAFAGFLFNCLVGTATKKLGCSSMIGKLSRRCQPSFLGPSTNPLCVCFGVVTFWRWYTSFSLIDDWCRLQYGAVRSRPRGQ